MTISKRLIADIRGLDAYDLRRLQMLIRGLLVDDEVRPGPDAPAREPKVTFRQQLVRCGRSGCGGCPHGPYWYAYWREGGRMRSRYIGKTLPGEDTPGAGPAD